MCKINEIQQLLRNVPVKKILGQYYSNAFLIELSNKYNLSSLEKDINGLSTFLHEYVHFLQNILTPIGTTGLGVSFAYEHNLVNFFSDQNNSQYVSEILQAKEWLEKTQGDADTKYDVHLHLPCKLEGSLLTIIGCDGSIETIELGNVHIYEAMCHLIQLSLFKDTVINRGIPNPYELLFIIMQTFFKNIRNISDIQLMLILEWSLHHSEPVIYCISVLEEINKDTSIIGNDKQLREFLLSYRVDDLLSFHYSDIQAENQKFLKGDLLKNCRDWLCDVLTKSEEITNNQDFPITDFFIDYKTRGISALSEMITQKIGCPQLLWDKDKYIIDQSILNSDGIYYTLIDNAIRLVFSELDPEADIVECDIKKYCNLYYSGCDLNANHIDVLPELCPLSCIIKNFGLFKEQTNE